MPKYQPDKRTTDQINSAFASHEMDGDQQIRAEAIRAHARHLAWTFATECPPSRELSLALTKLEEATMHAVSAIAREQPAATREG